MEHFSVTTRSYSETVDVPEKVPLKVAVGVKGENRRILSNIAEYLIIPDGKAAASCTHIQLMCLAAMLWLQHLVEHAHSYALLSQEIFSV